MLRRKISSELQRWLNTDHKLLYIVGARQVGKTYILKKLINDNFENRVYVNILGDARTYNVLRKSQSAQDFIERIINLYPVLEKENSAIFIDEIQVFYDEDSSLKDNNDKKIFDILTLSKEIVINTDIRFIFSGSLLGSISSSVRSFPEGYCLMYQMYPLDFEEFMWANDISEKTISDLKYSFDNLEPVKDYVHDDLIRLYKIYLMVGGMPEAVATYVDKHNFNDVEAVHKSIEEFIQFDISQYAPKKDKIHIKNIYKLLPSELNKENKRFILSDIESKSKNNKLETAFEWIHGAGVSLPVYNTSSPELPLEINKKSTLVKVFHEDVGILTYLLFKASAKLSLIDGDISINYGSIYENAVAQSLNSHGFPLYYYNSKKQGELDFIIEYDNSVLPIEVKSGKDYQKHSALDNIMKIKDYRIEKSFVLCNQNLYVDENIIYLPIYMVDFIQKR
ncbi:MAG: AAA family ATPase [Erysipelotrichaceae bacterium]|nr:AAA family ATPase [Erysipelotrichaceae bacterium]